MAQALGSNVATLLGPPGSSFPSAPFSTQVLLGLNLKRLRRARHWSTVDAGERLSMKATYLGFVETGRNNITLQTLCRLAAGFGVDVTDLLTAPPPPPPPPCIDPVSGGAKRAPFPQRP